MSEPEGNELEISHAVGVSAKVCGTTLHGPAGLEHMAAAENPSGSEV
jgi:hypothetical protein